MLPCLMYFTKESISVRYVNISTEIEFLINFWPPQNLLLAIKPERCLRGSAKVELTLLVQAGAHVGHVILQYIIQYTDMARFTEISDYE